MKRQIDVDVIPAFIDIQKYANDDSMRNFFAWGGRGGGKSIFMGDHHLFMGCVEEARYLMAREIQLSIKDSVHGLLKSRINHYDLKEYQVTEKSITNSITGTEFLFTGLSTVTEDKIKSLYNIKRCLVEEAHSITNRSLKILTPTIRAKGSKIYFIYNRKLENDPVHVYFNSFRTKREKMKYTAPDGKVYYWYLYHGDGTIGININYDGNPFFPEVLETERTKAKRDMHINEYNHIWLGMPEPQPVDAIIQLDDCVKAMEREINPVGVIELGVDVARGGKDSVVIAVRKGLKLIGLHEFKKNSKNEKMRCWQTAQRVMKIADFDKEILIKVDDTGVGGGVTDELERNGYNVVPVNFNQKAIDNDHYVNAISEMWFTIGNILNEIELIDDPELLEELTRRAEAPRDKKGRRGVESKDEFKKRYAGKSPDKADAVLLCYYEPEHHSHGAELGLDVFT